MHKGRTYPYHPHQYATEGWFWPGLCPWKIKVALVGSTDPPWNVAAHGWSTISEPGVVSADGTRIEWTILDYGGAGLYKLNIDAICDKSAIPFECLFTGVLFQGLVFYGFAISHRTYPQRTFGQSGFDHYRVPGNPFEFPGPPILIAPATYAEGGSPWTGPG